MTPQTESDTWQRRSALFDAACDMPEDARNTWLSSLSITAPDDALALTKMLQDFDKAKVQTDTNLNLAGVPAQQFTAHLDSATGNTNQHLNAGETVGAWQLINKIGEGGMGEVWLAQRADRTFEGRAAIKFLRADISVSNLASSTGQSQIVDRFLRERRLLARLTHPGIARMLDAGTHKGEPYLVMEHISGTPITAWATAHAPRVIDRVNLILKVCRATEHAHSQLIIHRDLKPNNVLVNAAGEPSLLDFGIAKLIVEAEEDVDTQTALTRLNGRGYTLGYCAPEQITGEATSVGVDVFSIGVLLFETLTGSLPFKNEGGRAAIEHAIIHTDAPSISKALEANKINALRPIDANNARGDLEAIVAKALRKNPADRYVTVSALASDLHRWLNNQPVAARRGNWQYMTKLWLKRNKALAIVGTAAFIAVNTGLVVARMQAVRANDEATRANIEAKRADSERETAVAQRRLAEIATAQTTSALAESESAKANAIHAEKLAEQSATAARASAKLAMSNEAKSKTAEASADKASQVATSEAAKAKAVSQYLVTLFESADPERAKGEKLTLREVLDAGSKNIGTQFAAQPETLAQMQAVLGKTYTALSLPKIALPLLHAASQAALSKHGAASMEYARALNQQAHAEIENELYADALRHYEKILPILKSAEVPTGEVMVKSVVNYSYALQKQGKYAEAENVLVPLRADILSTLGDKSWAFVDVENSRAVIASAQNITKNEIEILKSIEPLLNNPPLGKKVDALTIRNNIAVSIGRSGNFAEATARLEKVIADGEALLGDQAEITLRHRWFAGEFLRLQSRFRECAAQYERLGNLRVRSSGETHPLTVDVFSKTAYCANADGNSRLAAQYFKRAIAALPANDDPPQRNTMRTLTALQSVAFDIDDPKYDPASATAIALTARIKALGVALKLGVATPENFSRVTAAATAHARGGNVGAGLKELEQIATHPAFAGVATVRAIKAYLLALNNQFDLAQAEMQAVATIAKPRFTDTHPIYQVFGYVNAVIAARDDDAKLRAASSALQSATGRAVILPLSPNWFGL